MRDWGIWEWAAYGTLALSIIGDAIEQARRRWPSMSVKLPEFFNGPLWAFFPLVFLILGTAIFLGRELGLLGNRSPRQLTEVYALQKPELHLTIMGGNVFVPDTVPGWTGIGLNARIWNTGTPSTATSWSMVVIPNGGQRVVAQLTEIPNVLLAKGQVNSAKLLAEDSLETKTISTQIGMTPISGTLLFYVALPQVVVNDPGTVWEISVKDVYEKETTVHLLVGNWLQR